MNTTPRFTLLPDGCFRDEERLYCEHDGNLSVWYKLEYTPTLNPNDRKPFRACVELAAQCELAGGGWKLASPNELAALVNYTKMTPATDAPGIVSDWHWTDQVDVSSPSDCAWSVDPGCGFVGWSLQGSVGFAVACRRHYV